MTTPASNALVQFAYSAESQTTTVFAQTLIGASGAATLEKWNGTPGSFAYTTAGANGFRLVASVTKETAAGQYTFAFQGVAFNRVLGAYVTGINTTGLSAAYDRLNIVNAVPATPGAGVSSLTVQMGTAGVAANPASGDLLLWEFRFAGKPC